MPRTVIYPGTFDPITLGHVDMIERVSGLFDNVVVGVAVSERKTPFFDVQKRIAMVNSALSHLKSVEVVELKGLTVDFAKQNQATHIIRGLRSSADFEYEAEIAEMNRQMADTPIETIFFLTRPEYAFVSSTIVRELILLKAFDSLERFLPKTVIEQLS